MYLVHTRVNLKNGEALLEGKGISYMQLMKIHLPWKNQEHKYKLHKQPNIFFGVCVWVGEGILSKSLNLRNIKKLNHYLLANILSKLGQFG